MMNERTAFDDSYSSKKDESDQESSSDDDEEVSMINPFATGRSGTMRHRAARPQHDTLRNFDPYATSISSTDTNMNKADGDFRLRSPLDSTVTAMVSPSTMTSGEATYPRQSQSIPVGAEDYLEMEEEPPSRGELLEEPIRTQTGLLLTHRHTHYPHENGNRRLENETFMNTPGTRVLPTGEAFEVESQYLRSGHGNPYYEYSNSRQSSSLGLGKASRLLSYVRLWNAAFCVFLLIGTGVIIHSMRHEQSAAVEVDEQEAEVFQTINTSTEQQQMQAADSNQQITEQIILVPLQNMTHRRMVAQPEATLKDGEPHGIRHSLHELRQEFEGWVKDHNKMYHSDDEKEYRFKVWHDNHHRTIEKNERHGPCKVSKKPVFGSNFFKDLTTEEFTSQFLTGYNGPRADHKEKKPTQRRATQNHVKVEPVYRASSSCGWNVSCWLRWFMNTYAYGFGWNTEPGYDSDSYPEAIDWRDYGVVSDVHSQGNCGACWAITAVETIESAYAISSGTLIDLAESEVIVCDDSCEMCEGGWPQNAYEFAMDQGGLLAEGSWSYDGDLLYEMTLAGTGESDTYDASYLEDYRNSYCSNGSGSGDKNNNNNGQQRYAKPKGYTDATDRCVCYTDGTGCDCDEQDERKALQSVKKYGPATVCLEASTWQDYAGGVLTSDVGCSSAFLDMNHCVQAVGFAYIDSNAEEGDEAVEGQNQQSGSGSNSHSGSGSRDDGDRDGYWIIRNQWSNGWGMNGYVYVSMGENTCGVLNDMSVVYM